VDKLQPNDLPPRGSKKGTRFFCEEHGWILECIKVGHMQEHKEYPYVLKQASQSWSVLVIMERQDMKIYLIDLENKTMVA